MSIASLLDHTCRVWRLTETTTEVLRATQRSYALVAGMEALPCTTTRQATKLGELPPGVTTLGDRKVYLDGIVAVLERDVVEVYAGPDSPAALEVDAVTHPRGHHTELPVHEFKGRLPVVGS